MTQIQAESLPEILNGKDVEAQAKTGSGKTAAFGIGLLHTLDSQNYLTQALVLCPTRELADQVSKEIRRLARPIPNIKLSTLCGGTPMGPQLTSLEHHPHIVVGTPGRILKHVQKGSLQLDNIKTLVLDEADRMLDMGFIRDIRKVLALLPKQKQTLLFSATFSDEIKKLSNDLLRSPALVEVARRNTASETVDQVVHPVDKSRKRELLSFLIGSNNWKQVLVFNRTKHGANRLTEQLGKDGITAAAIHGNKSQGARTKALADFKAGTVRVQVATDIAARGIDIDQLPHVVNYELPNVAEDDVHRMGRTGRAGNEGQAMSLVCVDEHKLLKDIERLIKRDIPKTVIGDFAPDPSIKAEPINQGRGRQQGSRKPAGKRSSSSRNNQRSNFNGGSSNQGQSRRSAGQTQQRGR